MPIVVVIVVVIAICAIGLLIGTYFYNLAINVNTKGKTAQNPENDGLLPFELERDWIETAEVEDIFMQTFDGLLLHSMSAVNDPERWVILQHGYKSEGRNLSYCAEKFYNWGFSVMLVDARGHGESQGNYRGMGWHDRLDIIQWISYINEHYGCRAVLLYGISMGAATVMMASGEELPTNVKGVIEDCGYSSVKKEMAYNLNFSYKLPAFPILNMASIVCNLRAGFSLIRDGSCIKQLKKCKVPILFIHGDADTFVPFHMMEEVYNATSAPKEKLIIPGAKHGMACWDAPEKYWETIKKFSETYVPKI